MKLQGHWPAPAAGEEPDHVLLTDAAEQNKDYEHQLQVKTWS